MNEKSNNTPETQAKKSDQDTRDNLFAVIEEIHQTLRTLKPLTDFHKAVEDATDYDFRIYWDVRLVRGKDTPFAYVNGSSSLSSLFAPKLRIQAPGVIESEVREKISTPLMAAVMTEMEKECFEALEKQRMAYALATGEEGSMERCSGMRWHDDF